MCVRLKIILLVFLLLVSGIVFSATKPTNTKPKKPKDSVVITVTGVKNPVILKNINTALKTLKEKHITIPLTQISVVRVYKESPKTIINAIKPYGYFNATIANKSNTFALGLWHSNFQVNLGPPTTVSSVNIAVYGSAKGDKNFLKVIKVYPVKKGQVLLTGDFSSGNALLFQHAAKLGYFDAKMIESKIFINVKNHTARIVVKFDSGPRYFFGQTSFSKTPLNPKFLRKYLAYKVGQRYDASLVTTSQSRIADANYFDQVVMKPEIEKAKHFVTPMHILLKMRKRKSYTFGGGYSTDTGPRATVGFIYRWVNQWGHFFDAKFQGSMVNNVLQIAYHIPYPSPYKDLWTFRLAGGRLNINAGTSDSMKFAIDYKHTYTYWQHTFSLNFLREKYDINEFNLPNSQATMIYPSAHITYYSTPNHINPADGSRLIFDAAGTPKWLSAKEGFLEFRLGLKGVVTFWKRLQFVSRADFGRTYINQLNDLPLSLQLLAGGTETIRGFKYLSIGPGTQLVAFGNEIRFRIWKEMYASGFYDIGNVSNSQVFKNMYYSAGPGIVYRSPIGVIGIYAAWRLSQPYKKYPAFVFSMGPEL